MKTPHLGIPHDLLDKAKCIAIIPCDKKFSFIFGGNYGRGVATCRAAHGWSAPMFVAIDGGSVGYQIRSIHNLLEDQSRLLGASYIIIAIGGERMSGMKHTQSQAVSGICLALVALLTLTMLVPGWRLRQDMEFSITALHHS